MESVAGLVCVVTGASRGIGRGIAMELCRQKCTVYITGRTLTRPIGSASTKVEAQSLGSLEETARDASTLGGVCIPVQCDHSDDESSQRLFEKIIDEQGRLDVLVNNAFTGAELGVRLFGKKFWEKPLEIWNATHQVGLRSHYIASVFAVQQMLLQPRSSTGGHKGIIIHISSAAGLGYFSDVAYGVGKAGVDRLAADMAAELKPEGIPVVSLWPGMVKTEFVQASGDKVGDLQMPPESMESPDYTGKAIVQLLLRPAECQHFSGKILQCSEVCNKFGVPDVDGLMKKPLVRSKLVDSTLPALRMSRM